MSHEKKNLLLSIESWLFNRDPYKWFIIIPIYLGRISSPYTINNQGPFFHGSNVHPLFNFTDQLNAQAIPPKNRDPAVHHWEYPPGDGYISHQTGSLENHRLKMPFLGDMLVSWRVY